MLDLELFHILQRQNYKTGLRIKQEGKQEEKQ